MLICSTNGVRVCFQFWIYLCCITYYQTTEFIMIFSIRESWLILLIELGHDGLQFVTLFVLPFLPQNIYFIHKKTIHRRSKHTRFTKDKVSLSTRSASWFPVISQWTGIQQNIFSFREYFLTCSHSLGPPWPTIQIQISEKYKICIQESVSRYFSSQLHTKSFPRATGAYYRSEFMTKHGRAYFSCRLRVRLVLLRTLWCQG